MDDYEIGNHDDDDDDDAAAADDDDELPSTRWNYTDSAPEQKCQEVSPVLPNSLAPAEMLMMMTMITTMTRMKTAIKTLSIT